MAILVVRIEDASTLLMNEFFDYNGRCYALTRSRKENTDVCINLEDFYEGTVQSESLEDIPVVFVKAQDGGWAVIGYYKRAEVRKKIMRPSLLKVISGQTSEKHGCFLRMSGSRYLQHISESGIMRL